MKKNRKRGNGWTSLINACHAWVYYAMTVSLTGLWPRYKLYMCPKLGTTSTYSNLNAARKTVNRSTVLTSLCKSLIRNDLKKWVLHWIAVWCKAQISLLHVLTLNAPHSVFSLMGSTGTSTMRSSVDSPLNARPALLNGIHKLSLTQNFRPSRWLTLRKCLMYESWLFSATFINYLRPRCVLNVRLVL